MKGGKDEKWIFNSMCALDYAGFENQSEIDDLR